MSIVYQTLAHTHKGNRTTTSIIADFDHEILYAFCQITTGGRRIITRQFLFDFLWEFLFFCRLQKLIDSSNNVKQLHSAHDQN